VYITYVRLARATVSVRIFIWLSYLNFFYCYLLLCDLLYAAFKQIKMDGWTKKIDNCGSTERNSGSGRPRSLRTADNVSVIQDMICSQDDAPCSHINPCKIQEHIEHCNLA